ncbi:ribonuclease-III-like-domain-containing protein [Cercophora newfieldiana]|uniref:Ribonuclease-III-like-domain-containing protein n=1 Tax=Cercophora newfieldiana TaxID=92897 RepID=A0AA40CI96_9PEZI|nr:ribonuclease-III-like-domain-containing protein [Cercophora newfieldiana]
MALNSSRSAFSSACKALGQCRSAPQTAARQLVVAPVRQFSTSTARPSEAEKKEAEEESTQPPRWTYTPERMKMPFSINVAKKPSRSVWQCNDKPEVLDAMYKRFLGAGGDKLLPEEIKWLAITHKSFDQGRRGFNTRLAYFGRQILALEATRSILVTPAESLPPVHITDKFGRQPFQHPALANVDKLNAKQPQDIVHKDKLTKLAREVGLSQVIRWKPRLPENLEGSGLTVVLNTAVYAIIGAISLQHGAEVAARVARERVLKRFEA